MEGIYRMSHNACSVELNGGIKVFVRLFIWNTGKNHEWSFMVVSEDGKYCFQSCKFATSTLAINGILGFVNVVQGFCFRGKPSSPFDCLEELFADVIYS